MMRWIGLVAVAAFAVTGCQSTHDQAAKKGHGGKDTAKTVAITATAGITTKVAALITTESADGLHTVVVVELHSKDPKRSVVWAPIAVKVAGADGAVVGETNVAGADPILIRVPSLPAGGTSYYVNDQLTPSAKPTTATITLGGDLRAINPAPGVLKATGTITIDPDLGNQFLGTVTNTTSVTQEILILQGIARVGDRIVAAGTAIVRGLKAGQSVDYTGSLTGDPKGATLTVFVPVSNVPGVPGAPPAG
jgi:hypothetical protein